MPPAIQIITMADEVADYPEMLTMFAQHTANLLADPEFVAWVKAGVVGATVRQQ